MTEVSPWLLIVLTTALGCGGKSTSPRDGSANEAGADSGGNSGAGGSSASAGRAGEGGWSMAGTSAQGGSSMAGSGGIPGDERCTLPAPSLRACDGAPFFFHDVTSGECVGVDSSRCPDDYDRTFTSLAQCLAACASARPAPSACDATSDCIVAQLGCCGGCEPVAVEQLRAVHHERRDALGGDDCNVLCGACQDVTEWERTSQYFVPACAQGSCQVSDLRNTTATECDSDDDCTLRDGSACCEGCDGAGLVAVSNTESITAACAQNQGCDACASPIPDELEAGCNENGRCVVRTKPEVWDGRLLQGDPERCPPRSDSGVVCAGAAPGDCIYAGGTFGLSGIAQPVSCFCDQDSAPSPQWVCLATDAEGNSECPLKFPLGDTACTAGQQCTYGVGIAVASCSCAVVDESANGSFLCGS